ncbi:hypothetical protein DFH06DRAFT_1399769 [Mycena polygramma]|nr:hypothetical protein DFH06DRAFT_1399769 [Mycena polygramma]
MRVAQRVRYWSVAIRDKPPSFFSAAVKHVFLEDSPAPLPLKLSQVETILSACSRLSSLFVSCSRVLDSLQFIPVLDRLECLRHLSINLESLFEFTPINFAQPFLRNVTHLELSDIYYDLSDHPTGLVEGLALLPHLTHVGFYPVIPTAAALHALVRANIRLQCIVFLCDEKVEPESEDDRFVGIAPTDFKSNWVRSVTGGNDYWVLAERFIAAKRAWLAF